MGFDPVSMTVMAVAGAAATAGGKFMEGQAAQDRANYQAQVARNNAILAEQNAKWAEGQGAAEESANAMRVRSGVGRLRAGQGASGVRVGQDSGADVIGSAEALGELDTLTIRSNTARKVYGYKVAAQSDTSQAKMLEAEGENAATAGTISALGSLLSSASSVGKNYAAWQNVAPKGSGTKPFELY